MRRVVTPVLLGCLALTVAVTALFWPLTAAEFINLDDDRYVTGNAHVRSGLEADNVLWALTTFHGATWQPLTWLSFMLDAQLFGLDPGAFHRTNVFLHALNTAVFFLALVSMTGAVRRSLLAALLFGVHPFHVESVAWVAERKGLLSALFGFAALAVHVSWTRRRGTARYLAGLLLYAMSLTAKPMLVTLPFVLLLLDWWPLHRTGTTFRPPEACGRRRAAIIEKIPFFALAAASGAMAYRAEAAGGAISSLASLPLFNRLLNSLAAYGAYLGKTLWPSGLAVFYPHPWQEVPWRPALLSMLALAAVSLAAARLRRQPWLAVGWLWFLGTLVPVIGLVQIGRHAMADRFTYIPLAGLFVAGSWAAGELARARPLWRPPLAAAAGMIVLVLSVLSRIQAGYWRDGVTLYRHALRVTAANGPVEYNLGLTLARMGRKSEAADHYARALRINPDDAAVLNNLGNVLSDLGRLDEAVSCLRAAVKLQPMSAVAWNNLGSALLQKRQLGEAEVCLARAVGLNPGMADAHYNLGRTLDLEGNLEGAVKHYRLAAALNPGDGYVRHLLDSALGRMEGKRTLRTHP